MDKKHHCMLLSYFVANQFAAVIRTGQELLDSLDLMDSAGQEMILAGLSNRPDILAEALSSSQIIHGDNIVIGSSSSASNENDSSQASEEDIKRPKHLKKIQQILQDHPHHAKNLFI